MTTELQQLLNETRAGAAEQQRIGWDCQSWTSKLEGSPLCDVAGPVLQALEDHWATDDGISRAAVNDVGGGDPVRLLVATMAWGFGPIPYGPSRTATMLSTPDAVTLLGEMVEAAKVGSEIAFSSLFGNGRARIAGLSIAMGSKLLYFGAGGIHAAGGSPLIYDANVHWALTTLEGGWAAAPHPGKWMSAASYAEYVTRIDDFAAHSQLSPSDVESALFGASTWRRRRRRRAEIDRRT